MRTALLFGLALLTTPAGLQAQSSQFGVRGLGIPVRPLSPRAIATGGAFGLFDLESSVNPATPALAVQFASLFSSAQNFRRSTNPCFHPGIRVALLPANCKRKTGKKGNLYKNYRENKSEINYLT